MKNIKIILIAFIIIIIGYESGIMIANYMKTNGTLLNKISDNTELVWNGPRDKKVIAITFDDGPHPRYTPKILDLLKKYDIKGTFFVLGKHVEFYPETLKIIKDEGHEIGNHTYSHVDVKKIPSRKIEEEFNKTQQKIYDVIKEKPKIFRPPFGSYNTYLKDLAKRHNVKIILWSSSQDCKDWSNPGVKKIADTVINNVGNGDIILLHDYVNTTSQTYEALKIILPELKRRGYRFVTVSQLIKNKDYEYEMKIIEN
ncbi:polysaccharide deacetylase family protein [Tepidibacter mesophilus]|uniref:polysaccharide deacetylase family protein n=1 Tax=Tepidibacter mesophilus TaxID=655607 RepID=UPI000C07C343|nr:polysaccharide deacetylase family protein [Tepidibacter mesophilus]